MNNSFNRLSQYISKYHYLHFDPKNPNRKGEKIPVRKVTFFRKKSKMLMFQINRFAFSKQNRAKKINDTFDFEEELDIYPFYFVNKEAEDFDQLVGHSKSSSKQEIQQLKEVQGEGFFLEIGGFWSLGVFLLVSEEINLIFFILFCQF